jgi:hypothetical protein
VVGWSSTPDLWGRAFRWTRATGMQGLGVGGGLEGSLASAVTPDGTDVCGRSYGTAPSVSFRWSEATGLEDIGTNVWALGISADGGTIMCQGGNNGYLWTRASGLQPLPPFTLFGLVLSQPAWISADGATVIGFGTDGGGDFRVGYRWTAAAGYQSLIPQNVFLMEVTYASPRGDLVLGFAVPSGFQGVLANTTWTTTDNYLRMRGMDLSGWAAGSLSIRGASADLRTIVGNGWQPYGHQEGWIVTVPAGCYANCDDSTATPMLNVNDFVCFLNRFAAGDPFSNCDGSTDAPVLNVNDLVCFQARFAAGCP